MRVAARDVERQRLLAKHVLALFGGRDDRRGVMNVRGRDDHRVDVLALDEGGELVGAATDAEILGERLCPAAIDVVNARNHRVARALNGRGMRQAHDRARTD